MVGGNQWESKCEWTSSIQTEHLVRLVGFGETLFVTREGINCLKQ
jgi:hypothetical protein